MTPKSRLPSPTAPEVELIPYPMPHDLKASDFEMERSLSDWMEIWFGGFTEDEVLALYGEAEILVSAMLKLEFTRALCEVEDQLTAEQRFSVWQTLIGTEAQG